MQILVNPNSLKLELAGALNNLKLGKFASINLHSSFTNYVLDFNSYMCLASLVIIMCYNLVCCKWKCTFQ